MGGIIEEKSTKIGLRKSKAKEDVGQDGRIRLPKTFVVFPGSQE